MVSLLSLSAPNTAISRSSKFLSDLICRPVEIYLLYRFKSVQYTRHVIPPRAQKRLTSLMRRLSARKLCPGVRARWTSKESDTGRHKQRHREQTYWCREELLSFNACLATNYAYDGMPTPPTRRSRAISGFNLRGSESVCCPFASNSLARRPKRPPLRIPSQAYTLLAHLPFPFRGTDLCEVDAFIGRNRC